MMSACSIHLSPTPVSVAPPYGIFWKHCMMKWVIFSCQRSSHPLPLFSFQGHELWTLSFFFHIFCSPFSSFFFNTLSFVSIFLLWVNDHESYVGDGWRSSSPSFFVTAARAIVVPFFIFYFLFFFFSLFFFPFLFFSDTNICHRVWQHLCAGRSCTCHMIDSVAVRCKTEPKGPEYNLPKLDWLKHTTLFCIYSVFLFFFYCFLLTIISFFTFIPNSSLLSSFTSFFISYFFL